MKRLLNPQLSAVELVLTGIDSIPPELEKRFLTDEVNYLLMKNTLLFNTAKAQFKKDLHHVVIEGVDKVTINDYDFTSTQRDKEYFLRPKNGSDISYTVKLNH